MKYSIAYLGYSTKMLENLCLSTDFELKYVMYVPKRVENEFVEIFEKYGAKGLPIEAKPDFDKVFSELEDIDLFIMYKFEYILPMSFIESNRVINFHGGNLRTNRGAHAVVWSILRGDKETCLSMYQLTGGIDEGLLIEEYQVEVTDDDTPTTLNDKLQTGIPYLFDQLICYLDNKHKFELVLGGNYLPKIKESDFTIDLMNDPISIIKRKVNSQMSYLGAILYINAQKYRVKSIKETNPTNQNEFEVSFNGNKVIIESGGKCVELVVDGNCG